MQNRRGIPASSYWGLIDFRMGTPRLGIQVIDLARAIEMYLRRANAIGAVPIAYARLRYISIALERAHWPPAIRPAARWRLARRACWLAGRARASTQSQNSGSCMHDLI